MQQSPDNYCVILCGGIGSRLWPISTKELPKQFLDWFGTGQTLLQQTYQRFLQLFDSQHIYLVTNHLYTQLVTQQLPNLPQQQLLNEPIRRNTLPAVAWATTTIHAHNPHANLIVSPADQLILNQHNFEHDILDGLNYVKQNPCLLAMGVKPTRPDTSYGYIQADEHTPNQQFFKVKSFTEKPQRQFAQIFMNSGEFYWNTGLYLFNAQTMIDAIRDLLPDYRDNLTQETNNNAPPPHFDSLPNLSLDYSIMEKSQNTRLQVCTFGWADLGSWTSIHNNSPTDTNNNTTLNTQTLLYNCHNNIIALPNGRTAVINGLNNYIIAEKNNILLICPKNNPTELRHIMTDTQIKLGQEFI